MMTVSCDRFVKSLAFHAFSYIAGQENQIMTSISLSFGSGPH